PVQERPVGLHDLRQFGDELDGPGGDGPVRGEVVAATQEAVVDPGGAGLVRIHPGRQLHVTAHPLPQFALVHPSESTMRAYNTTVSDKSDGRGRRVADFGESFLARLLDTAPDAVVV